MRLGQYEVEREIGRGGMGVVLRARDASSRPVAIKLLQRSDPGAQARFVRERRLLGSLGANDGFVPLLDAGEAPEGSFVVMPLLEGGTLRDRLEKGALSLDATLELVRALAHALGRAHALGIVHRDLKPENVLYTKEGRPLVADLGLAKHFRFDVPGASQSGAEITKRGSLLGTAGYMPGEQMRDAQAVGPEADVFALGAILQECLTGEPAFPGETALEIVTRVDAGDAAPLLGRAPAWLERVLRRALATDPARRYPDGSALVRALATERARGRRAIAWRIAGALGVCAVVVIALAASRSRPAERRPPALDASVPRSTTRTAAAAPDPLAAASARTRARVFYDLGLSRCDRGDVEGGLAELTRAIEIDPTFAWAWFKRALFRAARGDKDGALEDYARAVEADPKHVLSWTNSAVIRAERGDLAGAEAHYTRAVEADPKSGMAWAGRGFTRVRRGDEDGAIADYTRAIEAEPHALQAAACANRAGLREKRNDPDGALADYTRAIEIEPTFAGAYMGRGLVRMRRGDLAGARADFTLAIEADPKFAKAFVNRAYVRSDEGDLEGALQDFNRAIDADPRSFDGFCGRSQVFAYRKNRAAALADLASAEAISPGHVDLKRARDAVDRILAR